MPKDQAMKFLNAVYTGKDKYDLFIKERLIGEKSIWDTITKEKIPTFVFNNKEITITVNKELVNIKEERKLMSRFLMALCSRPDIDLSHYLGEFRLSVIPRSLFTVMAVYARPPINLLWPPNSENFTLMTIVVTKVLTIPLKRKLLYSTAWQLSIKSTLKNPR